MLSIAEMLAVNDDRVLFDSTLAKLSSNINNKFCFDDLLPSPQLQAAQILQILIDLDTTASVKVQHDLKIL